MLGTKRYDLRFKDALWVIRDSFTGAHLTDTKDAAQLKLRLTRNMVIIVGIVAVISFGFWIVH